MLTIVMGPTCSGKSHLIKEKYADAKVIDLYNFQSYGMSVDEVWQSYIDCAEALKTALIECDDVVLEHTLLKRKRREWYIEQIREVYSGDIKIICIAPSAKQLAKNASQRKICLTENDAKAMLEILEIPTKDEGYSNIEIIT